MITFLLVVTDSILFLMNDFFLLLNGVNAATLITPVILVLIHKYFHLQNET